MSRDNPNEFFDQVERLGKRLTALNELNAREREARDRGSRNSNQNDYSGYSSSWDSDRSGSAGGGIVVGIIVLLVVGLFAVGLSSNKPARVDNSPMSNGLLKISAGLERPGQKIDTGTSFTWQPAYMEVNAGYKTRISAQEGMYYKHNWVLVEQGKEDSVVRAAEKAGCSFPGNQCGMEDIKGILAADPDDHSPLPALEPGTYTYLCVTSGHYAKGMKGTLVAKPVDSGVTNVSVGGTNSSGIEGSNPKKEVEILLRHPTQDNFEFQPKHIEISSKTDLYISLRKELDRFSGPGWMYTHDWILVPQGTEAQVIADVEEPGGSVGISEIENVIAVNPKPGELFPVLPPGTYTYLCPYQYDNGMKGTLVVKP